jgi:hypothetical protein
MKDWKWTQDLKTLLWIIGALVFRICRLSSSAEGKKQMIKPKRSAVQQLADELERQALHPLSSRQTISDSQAEPEFHANYKRLRAERLAREAVELGLKVKK